MRLGREYEDANLPLAVKRLSQAGVRLSEVLNECLSPEPKKAIPAPHFPKQSSPPPCRHRRRRESGDIASMNMSVSTYRS